jgi:spore germination protein GerM
MKRFAFIGAAIAFLLACNLLSPAASPQQAAADTAIPTAQAATNAEPAAAGTNAPYGMTAVQVYFTNASTFLPEPVVRYIPRTDNRAVLVHSTLKELVKGPTESEKNAGLTSWFSAETAGTVKGVAAAMGEFEVDVTRWKALIPNASSSAGSRMLLAELNGTVFQFDFVDSVTYTLDGDCAAFWEWLQMECRTVTRAEWEAG